MADLARIKRNVAKMAGMNAPVADIDGYIASEGVSVDDVRNFKPQATAPKSLLDQAGDQLSASFTAGVDAIPFVGPQVLGGLENVKAAVQSKVYGETTPEQVHASDQQQVDENPVAATVGSIAGPTLALAPLGMTALGARALGLTGSLGARVLFGAGSGAVISGGDAAVRGASPEDMIKATVTGAGLGGALPAVAKGAGAVLDGVLGRAVPKEAKMLARAARDDDVPVTEINQRLTDMGDGAMVMDLGPNLQRQAGAVAATPGPGQRVVRQAVQNRAAGARGRVNDDVDATVGAGPDLDALREQVVAHQSAAADPIYTRVRPMPVQSTPNLRFVLQTPMGQRAYAHAVELAANDGIRMGPYRPGEGMTVGDMDYTKRALDDIAGAAKRTGEGNTARQAGQLTAALRREVDLQVPEYRQAREAFAGPAQVLDAMDAGQTLFTKEMTPAHVQRALAGMSASERDAYLQSARSWVEARLGNAVNDARSFRDLFRKSWNEEKLRLVLGDNIANDLLRRLDRETTFGATTHVVAGNSETAARAAAMGEVAPEIGRTWRPEGPLGAFLTAIDAARRGASGRLQPAANERLAGIHTQRQVPQAVIEQLQRAGREAPRGRIAPAAVALAAEQQDGPLKITVRGGR